MHIFLSAVAVLSWRGCPIDSDSWFALNNFTVDYAEPWLATVVHQAPVFRWVHTASGEGTQMNGALQHS